MATDEQKREFIAQHMDADLHYLLEDAGVILQPQYAIAQLYRTIKHFSAFGDTRKEIRDACKDDFGLDPTTDAATRAQVAAVITAWEAAKEFVAQENKVKAESRALGVSKPLANTDRAAMRRAMETAHGKKPDHELPSPEYLAHKMEEIELNELQASPLDEVTSMEDSVNTSLQSTLDTDGRIRVVKTKSKGSLPQNSEQLRVKYRVESNAWLMLSAKFKQKSWLSGFSPKVFEDFTDFILGPKVFNLQVPRSDGSDTLAPLQPAWTIILRYEYELRKAAIKLVRDEGETLANAMSLVVRDPELKEIYFTSPIALSKNARSHPPPALEDHTSLKRARRETRNDTKGKGGKGTGKGGKGGKGKVKLSLTPDGRQICFKYNNGSCPGNCGRVHVCQIKGCLGPHPAKEHGKAQEQKK